eukprot:PhM_4_TR1342/c3_g2_i1/m.96623
MSEYLTLPILYIDHVYEQQQQQQSSSASPLIRIFGRSLPPDEKTVCCSVIGVYPYFMVPLPNNTTSSGSSALTHTVAAFRRALEAAVIATYHLRPGSALIHDIELVRGTSLYGYHSGDTSTVFMKVLLYKAYDVQRCANVCSTMPMHFNNNNNNNNVE